MKRKCPNPKCHYHQRSDLVVKDGRYFRKNDSKWIFRFRCQSCRRRFSAASFSALFGQKKRSVNAPLRRLLASGVSMRRAAKILQVHQITVARKLVFLAQRAQLSQEKLLQQFQKMPAQRVQFDDLITIEHTKMKPLTVSIAVNKETRAILGASVGRIPAFGLLAEKSRKKYGPRANEHKKTLENLFHKIRHSIDPAAHLESDEHKLYPEVIKKFFPAATHGFFKGGRGCVAGQGELKKKHFDPLFAINHTCAMFRGNINRLIRKTWCTTKLPERIQLHIDLFIDYYNREILA